MAYFIYFLAAIGFWLLGWTVVLGMALLSRTAAARRPLSLLDQDDVLEP